MGWIGATKDLHAALRVLECDTDEAGRFYVSSGIYSDPSGEESVVSDDATYFSRGRPLALAAALIATGYGARVQVIA